MDLLSPKGKVAWIDGDVLHHWCLWNTSDIASYQQNVEKQIESWSLSAVAEDFRVVVGGDSNFRKEFYPEYKETKGRSAARKTRPTHEVSCLNWLKGEPFTIVAEGVEADDVIAIEGASLPETTVIITVDKDLLQVPGHHFNPRKGAALGNRNINAKEAFDFFKLQLLKGDPMDKIPGLPGVGEKKAEKFLAEGADVIDIYKEVVGKDWLELFLFNGRLLFLLRSYSDAFSLERYKELEYEAEQRALEVCT
jgi:5'-3' exonuclease